MLCRPFIGIYWHINFFPCNKPVKMEMCVYVSIAVTALDSAFLHVPSPRKALLDINFILNKPHHALPNEYEITKAWSKRRNINCSQLLNWSFSCSSICLLSYPRLYNPYLPFKAQLQHIFFCDAYLNLSKITEKLIANLSNAVGTGSK